MALGDDSEEFATTRLTFKSSQSFDTVIARLRCQTNRCNEPVSKPPIPYKPYASMTQDEFKEYINDMQGPSGFMYFHELEYGSWLNVLGIGKGMRMKKFIIGNPLIAATILNADLRTALNVPVELLIRELADEGGGVKIVYLQPSETMVAQACRTQDLVDHIKMLDTMLRKLVDNVANSEVQVSCS